MNSDPYAYLEAGNNAATLAWQEAQNARARAVLAGLSGRAALRERLDGLLQTGSIGAPRVRGERTFVSLRSGTQDQPQLVLAADGEPDRVLLDPAAIDASGLTSLDYFAPSPRGKYVAYGLSQGGDERSTLSVLDVATGAPLEDRIPHARWASIAWLPDESGFYYTAHPDGGDFDQRVCFHALGTAHASDRIVFGEGRRREETFGCELSEDGRWLLLSAQWGWAENELLLIDRTAPDGEAAPRTIFRVPKATARASFGRDGAIVLSTDGAPNGRVFRVDLARPERDDWQEIVDESADAIEFAEPTKAGVLVGWLHDVTARLALRLPDGRMVPIPLGTASLGDLSVTADASVAYARVATYFDPPRVLRIDLAAEPPAVTTWRALESGVDPSQYAVRQEWCQSKDGTGIPMFVLAHRETPRDGTAPAIAYGYGGFSIALTPDFLPAATPWLDAGGVYAIVNLRGGAEFGEAWHEAGMRERKQNVFDDFAAAIESLGTSGIADPARIGIFGGSNGGLLVGALATQRPELARAVVCAVPVLDMLRYHLFSIGRFWIPEYGDPDVPGDAAFLAAYSPYANVREGTRYPAMLVLSAMSDSRVDPMHARKFAAKVAHANGPDGAPVLCLIESDAGHGQGKPRSKQIEEIVDRFAFFAWQLGVTSLTSGSADGSLAGASLAGKAP